MLFVFRPLSNSRRSKELFKFNQMSGESLCGGLIKINCFAAEPDTKKVEQIKSSEKGQEQQQKGENNSHM